MRCGRVGGGVGWWVALLIAFIYRIRLGAGDPYQTPPDIRDRHQLSIPAANVLLRTTLRRLQALRPEYFYANVHTPLAIAAQISLDAPDTAASADPYPDSAPERRLLAREAADHARSIVDRLVSYRPGEDTMRRRRRQAYRQILSALAAAADGDGRDLLAHCTQRLGLAELPAARMLRRFARLVADADADWVTRAVGGRGC